MLDWGRGRWAVAQILILIRNFYSFGKKLPWAYLISHYVSSFITKKTENKPGPQRYRPNREAQE